MTTTYYEHSLDNLISMFDEVCCWFTNLGFEYSRNRYGIYKKVFNKFIDLTKDIDNESDLLDFKNSFDNTYVEVNEIIRVHNCLKTLDSSDFIDQIKKVTSGHEFRGNNNNDQARDFLFELSVASRFISEGYSVSLTSICDVVVDLGNDGTLFVECKRIKSAKQIGKNVKKANEQILKRIEVQSSSQVHGLVAVNITDLLPKNSMLYPDSKTAATAIHRGISNNYVKRELKQFSAGYNRKCFGVMVESAVMNYLSDKSPQKGFVYSRHTEYLPYFDNVAFKNLAPKLSNQDIVS